MLAGGATATQPSAVFAQPRTSAELCSSAVLRLQFDPHRRMVARALNAAHRPVNACGRKPSFEGLAQQDVIDPQPSVPLPAVAAVVPERECPLP